MDEQTKGLSLRDGVVVVLRHRRLVIALFAVSVALGTALAILLPPQYRAAAKILLTTDRADISTDADRPSVIGRRNEVPEGQINSEVEILRSRDVVGAALSDEPEPQEDTGDASFAARAVAATASWVRQTLRAGYQMIHGAHDFSPLTPLDWEVSAVQPRLEIARIKGSNILEVGITGADPTWNRDFVNRWAAAYVEHHAKMQQITEAEDFFTQQSRLLQEKLTASEAALKDVRERAGSLAGQQQEIHDRLNEFSGELARTKIARAEQEERVAFLERTQKGAGSTGRVATPQLLELEAKRAELLGRYKPGSERMRDIDDQIRRLRSAIAGYDTVTPGGQAGALGGGTDVIAARATLAALKGKEDALTRQREEYRKQAEMLDAQNFDLARLTRQAKMDEEAFVSYVRTAEQSRLSNALEQSKLLRLSIVEPASLPFQPVSPNRGGILLFSLLAGMVLGVGSALLRDRFDPTVKTAADVKRYANLETLTVLRERI